MAVRLRPIQLATLFRIPIRVSYGWIPVVFLHIYAVSVFYLPRHLPDFHPLAYWTLGGVTTLLLFLSVLGHEIGHALVARAEGIRIYDITLHLFGGFARFEHEAHTPGSEFRIAVAGPSASFLYAVVFFLLNQLSVHVFDSRPAALITNYLALSNLILALFNLLPGFPLDGGRVFRAWLWARWGDYWRASRWAIGVGQGIAYLLVGLGIFWVLRARTSADIFAGAWSILVGIFLRDVAENSRLSLKQVDQMRRIRVADVMRDPPALLPPEMTIEELAARVLPKHRSRTFPVSRDRRLHGILLVPALHALPREQWARTTVRDLMQPVAPSMFVHPETPLWEAHRLLRRNGLGASAVLDADGYIVGYLALEDFRSDAHAP
ncbi:MAG: site-2 protease family protein [Blastocatellia bacterium]|nr:site-2 protease family protein [Blastocatellia bacterium]